MRHLHRELLVLAVAAASAPACFYDANTSADGAVDDYPLPGASAQIPDWPDAAARRELIINSSTSSLGLTLVDALAGTEIPHTLPVLGGVLGFVPDDHGQLALEELQVVLGDAHIPTRSSGDLVLTGIRIESEPGLHLPVTFREPGHQGFLKAPITLRLDWKLVGDSGRAWPLAQQTLRGAMLYVHVGAGPDGRLRADALGIDTGTFWQWAGLYALKDAVLTLEAREPAIG